MSREPEIKMEVLLGRSHSDRQVLATWAFGVVPIVLSLRGPDMSPHMRLLTVSDETADSDGSEEGRQTQLRRTRTSPLPPRGHELPAAKCSVFARDCGQRRGPSARCWAPIGGLRRVAQAC